MSEQTKTEKAAEESAEGAENKTIYDSVFHTLLQNLPQLLIALINMTFGKNYAEDTEIVQLKEKHHHKSGYIITDTFFLIGDITYHIECQSNPDGTMVLRMVEYDMMIALEEAFRKKSDTIKMPNSCVVYLRHTKNTPDVYRATILGQDGQTMEYRCPVIKVQNYSLDELFEKNLLMLLPYYIMRYEDKFQNMEEDAELRKQFLMEVTALSDRLEAAVSPNDKSGVYQDLMELITEIAKYELRAYQQTLKGVRKIMEARILPLPSDSIRIARRKGREEGLEEGAANMFNSMIRTMYEKGCSVLQISRFIDRSEDTVRNSLISQGLILQ